jgi:hypothetical protein
MLIMCYCMIMLVGAFGIKASKAIFLACPCPLTVVSMSGSGLPVETFDGDALMKWSRKITAVIRHSTTAERRDGKPAGTSKELSHMLASVGSSRRFGSLTEAMARQIIRSEDRLQLSWETDAVGWQAEVVSALPSRHHARDQRQRGAQ